MSVRPGRATPLLLLACLAGPAGGADSPLTLADLEAYRLALAAKPGAMAPLVEFRDLWEHPEAHLGRAVAVEGRVARVFRQPKLGEFPALVEAWVVSDSRDPFCLVFPEPKSPGAVEIGVAVRFSGTFLRRIEYRGGDVARLAPLIVGPSAPAVGPPAAGLDGSAWSPADWTLGAAGGLVVALALARRHLARPSPRARPVGPPPLFDDGEVGRDDEEGGGTDECRR